MTRRSRCGISRARAGGARPPRASEAEDDSRKGLGITNLDDALAALDAGADMLGFNFYARSPRYVTPAEARKIIGRLPDGLTCVGVFVNEPAPAEVERIAREAGLGAA